MPKIYKSRNIVVQSPSCVQLFVTPWTAACQAFLSLTIPRSLPRFMSIASVMPSIHLILWCPLLLLPSIFPRIRVFSNELAVHIRWPNYGSFSFSISPSNKYSGLISLRIDWFNLLAVQGTQDSSPASQFEGIDSLVLCHLYGPTLTTIRDYWEDYNPDDMDLVGRVTSLLFNTLSRFVMAFPAKKQSPSDFRAAVTICSDFRAQEEPICHYFHLFPFYLLWSNEAGCHGLSFFNT